MISGWSAALPWGDGDLQLPRVDAGVGDQLEEGQQLALGEGVDLGVAGDLAAGGLDVAHGLEGPRPALGHAAQVVVGGLQAVDREGDAADAGLDHGVDALAVEVVAAGGHRAAHAGLADRPDEEDEVVAQVGLAADQHDLAGAHGLEVLDDLQALLGGELVGAAMAGTRAAVGALLVAGEGQLPHGPARAGGGGARLLAGPAVARGR
jgi:hypothetical protein